MKKLLIVGLVFGLFTALGFFTVSVLRSVDAVTNNVKEYQKLVDEREQRYLYQIRELRSDIGVRDMQIAALKYSNQQLLAQLERQKKPHKDSLRGSIFCKSVC